MAFNPFFVRLVSLYLFFCERFHYHIFFEGSSSTLFMSSLLAADLKSNTLGVMSSVSIDFRVLGDVLGMIFMSKSPTILSCFNLCFYYNERNKVHGLLTKDYSLRVRLAVFVFVLVHPFRSS